MCGPVSARTAALTGPEISAFRLGCMSMSGTPDEAENTATVHAALDAGHLDSEH